MTPVRYVGRFAPSPTGPLHFGSLIAALASYLDARAVGGAWLVRMEDVDTERNVPGADDGILRALEGFGFSWDGPVLRQTERSAAYGEALERLIAQGLAFPCACSRSAVKRTAIELGLAPASDGGWVYSGACRSGLPPGCAARAWRLRVPAAKAAPLVFSDAVHGSFEQNLATEVGDFVLKRADGPFAYQLAVVVDDAAQGVTDVVRGADLLDATARQIYLQGCLGLPTPSYLHLPLATNAAGEKLSKQTLAPALDIKRASEILLSALKFLGYTDLAVLATSPPRDILAWAVPRWRRALVPAQRHIHV